MRRAETLSIPEANTGLRKTIRSGRYSPRGYAANNASQTPEDSGWRRVPMKIQDATALVTGGSSGIGLAIAEMLVEAGARVAITGRDERRLQEAAHALKAHPIRADAANEADVMRTYQDVLEKFGHL